MATRTRTRLEASINEDRQASIPELRPIGVAAERYDVAILGGGLAGLTLAIQLKRERPNTSVLVLEKREGPAPLAAFKVGESTVPSGAEYFAAVVGMKEHLETEHNIKLGLRYFPPAGDNSDLTRRVELGPARYPPHDNYQIDRGLFENELMARARALGVDVLQGCRVDEVTLGQEHHAVAYSQLGAERSVKARWVVDAAGRASLLKRRLGLAKPVGHNINSAWFRLAGGLDIEDWGRDDTEWMERMVEPGTRQFSTNHLMGDGYWIWMIPLKTGPISIGVCADPRIHPFEEMNELERLIDWLERHEPQLAAAVKPRIGEIEDFLRVEDFAYGVERILSPDRWCLVGEAGAFSDPLYSPGSDFISYSNMFAAEVIERDLDGEDVAERLEFLNDLYLRCFDYVLAKYEDMYPVFGNAWVATPKLVFDTFQSHTGIVLLTVNGKMTDVEFMKRVSPDLDRLFRFNDVIQRFFREWHELQRKPLEGVWGTRPPKPLRDGFIAMVQDFDDDGLHEKIREDVRTAEAFGVTLFAKACDALAEKPDLDRPINPYAIGLDPARWEEDGLYEEPGMTVDEARELTLGLDDIFGEGPPSYIGGPPGGGPPGGGPPGGGPRG